MKQKRVIPYTGVAVEPKNWFSFITKAHKTSTFSQMIISMLVVGVYTWIVVFLMKKFADLEHISNTVHSILGITLGLLLVIRTNTAYDRWWEGRKAVGALVNGSRNLAIKLHTLIDASQVDLRYQLAGLISNYAFAMKEHLREGVKFEELEDLDETFIEELKHVYHVPNRIAARIYEVVHEQYHNNPKIDGFNLTMLDKQMEDFTNIVGICERIKKTPLPLAYSMHLKFFIMVYVMTLPIGLYDELHYWTIPAVMVVFYAMVGLELIGEEIEDPFGTDENDLPMDGIARTIRHNIFEILTPESTQRKN